MFNKKIKERLQDLEDVFSGYKMGHIVDVIKSKIDKNDLVECETCGCLLKEDTAIKGDSYITKVEKKEHYRYIGYIRTGTKEVITNDHYCKVHAPKQKATKNKAGRPKKKK